MPIDNPDKSDQSVAAKADQANNAKPPADPLNDLTVIEPAIDELRRQRLRVALKLMLLAAAGLLVYVFAASFFTSQPGEKTFRTMRLSVSNQQPGTVEWYNWNGRPVLILRRSPEQLTQLDYLDGELQDATSRRSKQPDFALNAHRSREPEWFVAIASGTDLSCAIVWLEAQAEKFRGKPWPGGFTDSCRGARYDLAGRVFTQQHAKKNLSVPEYSQPEPGIIVLGAGG